MSVGVKGQNILRRSSFALAGLGHAFRHERSFRTHCMAGLFAIIFTLWLSPGWVWASIVSAAIALVLLTELLNTAIEHALDGLHPENASFVAVAKDCAAASVLVASILALIVFVFMILGNWRWG